MGIISSYIFYKAGKRKARKKMEKSLDYIREDIEDFLEKYGDHFDPDEVDRLIEELYD